VTNAHSYNRSTTRRNSKYNVKVSPNNFFYRLIDWSINLPWLQ